LIAGQKKMGILLDMKKLFQFDFTHFRGDLLGGITAGIVALPLALAFGEETELGAIAGLYGAIAIGIVAAIFGGTPTQISGPTAPMTVVSAVVILEAIAYSGSLEAAFPIIIATFFLAGLIELLFGVFRIGRYIRYIPYSVVSGFMSGIGAIIIISQIFPFFGASSPQGGSLAVVSRLQELPGVINGYSAAVGGITILIIYLWPRINKSIPGSLIALILVSIGVFLLAPGVVSVINDNSAEGVPTGLPKVHFDFFVVFTDVSNLKMVLEFAITLAALGAIDSLLTSVVADNITKTKHDSNQELIGQGLGNMAAAFIGGLPGAGATMRTVINVNSGGRTKISGVVAGLLLLIVLLGAGPLVGVIPNAVLAGILITVGIGIIDYKGFRHLRSIPLSDAIIMITVFLLTVFLGLLEAVAIGMVLASVLFMKKVSEYVEEGVESVPLRGFSREVLWQDEENLVDKIGDRVYIKHLNGPLFFGFTSRFQEMVKALPEMEVVIIRMDRVPYVDQSGLYAVEEAVLGLLERDVATVLTGIHGQPLDMFRRINILPGLIPDEFCFQDFEQCVLWLERYLHQEGTLVPLSRIQKAHRSPDLSDVREV
jgi:SulP family sulfate permease